MPRQKITRTLKRFFLQSGIYGTLRRLYPNRSVSILRYHAVVEPEKNTYTTPTIAVSPKEFEAHVHYFSTHYRVLPLPEVVEALWNNFPLPANCVVFTFDDGYADNLQAARILAKYQASGTFFLTTDPISRKEPFWLAEITHLILTTPHRELTVKLGSWEQNFLLYNTRFRWKAIREVVRFIKSNNRATRESIREQIRQQLCSGIESEAILNLMLNWEQVREMLALGMMVGSHTLTHLNLPNAEAEDARREIEQSRKVLEEELDREILHFSYPNSGPYPYFNKLIRAYVEEAGYKSSCTSEKGFAGRNSDLLALRRVRTVPQLEEVLHFMEWDRVFSRNGTSP
ncbi:MAG: polysaccharide deacetylase family protein [Calditrichaeota bacterium]|nr:MAG: polysaccharide deacetylase family protein [Calditrichota bacterium]